MKRVIAFLTAVLIAAAPAVSGEYESWANWQRHIDDAYKGLKHRKVPGKTVGLVVPASWAMSSCVRGITVASFAVAYTVAMSDSRRSTRVSAGR